MTPSEVVLKVTFDSFLINLSRRFPSARIFIWCNRENNVIEVIVKNLEDYPQVMEEIRTRNLLDVVAESYDNHRLSLIIRKSHCTMENTIVKHTGSLDLLNIFPNSVENAWGYHRLIVFRHEDLEELLRRIEKCGWIYKVLRKVPFDGFIASSLTLTADALFSDLTERQMDALLTAHRHGHYVPPRRADVQAIAAEERVPRKTFQEHLKKTENKLSEPSFRTLNCLTTPQSRRGKDST
jgi:predicted DNA binding protein